MNSGKIKWLLVFGAVILFVLLFIAPKTPDSIEKKEVSESVGKLNTNANLDVYLNMSLKSLSPELKKKYDDFILKNLNDSLQNFWSKLKRPDLTSFFSEKVAMKTNSSDDWFKAGNRYYYSVQFNKDKSEIEVLFMSAIRCFEKAVYVNPKNTDAEIMLASCFVEGTQNPMEGVSRLKKIEQKDSNNVKLQLAFAFFSEKSGQLDKAISRFNKVLMIDSTQTEVYLHLADAYEQQGKKDQTIAMLEKYASRSGDITAKIEIEKYIKQLKTNIN